MEYHFGFHKNGILCGPIENIAEQLFRGKPALPVRIFEHQVLKCPPPQAFHVLREKVAADRGKHTRKAAFFQGIRQLYAATRCYATAAGNIRMLREILPKHPAQLVPDRKSVV